MDRERERRQLTDRRASDRQATAITDAAAAFADLCRAGTTVLTAMVEAEAPPAAEEVRRIQIAVAAGREPFPPERCPLCRGAGEVTTHPRTQAPGWVCANGHAPVWVLSPEAVRAQQGAR